MSRRPTPLNLNLPGGLGSAGALFIVWLGSLAPLPAQTYSVVELPPIPGDVETAATGINNLGHIIGTSTDASGRKVPVVWTHGGKKMGPPQVLPVLSAAGAVPADINDFRIIVGQAVTPSGEVVACLWPDSTRIQDLALGQKFSTATAINDRGDIAGYYMQDGSVPVGFTVENGNTRLVDETQSTKAAALNDLGQILANYISQTENRPFLLKGTAVTDLAQAESSSNSEGVRINNGGLVVGSADVEVEGEERELAALWQNGGCRILGDLGGGYSKAAAINAFGDIVGGSHAAAPLTVTPPTGSETLSKSAKSTRTFVNEVERAFLIRGPDGPMVDLNTRIGSKSSWILLDATDINDRGWIVGYGILDKGKLKTGANNPVVRGFLLIPSSLPSALELTLRPVDAGPIRAGDAVDVLVHANHSVTQWSATLDGVPVPVSYTQPLRVRISPTTAGSHTVTVRSLGKKGVLLATATAVLNVEAASD